MFVAEERTGVGGRPGGASGKRPCAFPAEDGASGTGCAAPARPGSSYCEAHHAQCHLPRDSAAERREMRYVEALAAVAGGRLGRPGRTPPEQSLSRLQRAARIFLLQHRSCFVQRTGDRHRG